MWSGEGNSTLLHLPHRTLPLLVLARSATGSPTTDIARHLIFNGPEKYFVLFLLWNFQYFLLDQLFLSVIA